MILFMSIVSNSRDIVIRLRYRSIKTAINVRTLRILFLEKDVKELDIFEFINLYNYFINSVDVID